MKIDDMKAGKDLDILIATKVMGYNVKKYFAWDGARSGWWNGKENAPFNPSKDIAAAWKVVHKLPGQFFIYKLRDGWYAKFSWYPAYGQTTAKTAPLAICRAALKAVGYGDK